uniref:Secreted protein n=1 Tax=Steinernema glaseri TaxID=37863 RepID=A0A1I7ZYT9_9BILA
MKQTVHCCFVFVLCSAKKAPCRSRRQPHELTFYRPAAASTPQSPLFFPPHGAVKLSHPSVATSEPHEEGH